MSSWLQRERIIFALTLSISMYAGVLFLILTGFFGDPVDCSKLFLFLLPVLVLSLAPIGFFWEHLLRHGTLRGVRPRSEVPKLHLYVLSTVALLGGTVVTIVAKTKFPDCSVLMTLAVAVFIALTHRYVNVLFPKS